MTVPARMDAVIAWVDGSDPRHAAKRRAAMQQLGIPEDKPMNFASATRFSDLGEIYYCIASILKYAPFIDRIFVIADDQAPAQIGAFERQGLCAPGRIRVVDHRELFRGNEQFLPTFNSLTIETLMWNIDGLSEYFLYFNDDEFLNAPLTPEDLVRADGTLRLMGKLEPVAGKMRSQRLRMLLHRLLGRKHMRTRPYLAQALAAKVLGHEQFLAVGHVPHLLRTETMRRYFTSHPAVLEAQLRHPFRSVEQFVPYVLANQIELAAGHAVVEPNQPTLYMTPANADNAESQLAGLRAGELRYGCVQSLDEFSDARRAALRLTMAEKFAGFLPEGLDLP